MATTITGQHQFAGFTSSSLTASGARGVVDPASLVAGKNQIGHESQSISENESSSSSAAATAALGARPLSGKAVAASVEPKQITSNLNGFASGKQVAKVSHMGTHVLIVY